jgi:PKD repeat protein
MVDTNGDIYIVSKRLSSNKIYRATYPQSTTETITLELVATLPEKLEFKWITAGDISPNGEWIILRNDQSDDYASIWHRTPGTDIKQTFGNKHIIIDINDEPQGEAICYDSDSLGFYTVSEHAGHESVPIWYYQASHLQTTNQKNNSGFDWFLLIIILIMLILVIIFIIARNSKVNNLVFGIVIIIAVGLYASTNLFEKEAIKTDYIEIPNIDSQEKLLTVSYNSTDYNYSLDELMSSFKSVSGLGTKINQIGAISGPNNYTGVPISLLLQSIDDLPNNYWLIASASDYEYNFSKESVSGKIVLYSENGNSYGLGNVTMILAYEINDECIDETSGGPLRIGFIDDKGSITHSSMWASSINKLIVIKSENNIVNNCDIPPVISINVSNVSGNAPLTIYFRGNASYPDGDIASLEWDFGDGRSDNKKDTYHTYKKADSYVVSFKVTDNNGSTCIETVQINVSYLVVDGYVSPTDFKNPSNDWDNPEHTFDDNINTLARCTKTGFWGWRWTGYLELIPPISLECNKIRFKAWYDSRWCDEIDIDLFFNNEWNDIYQGDYKNKEWEIIEFPLNTISNVRVKFHLRQAFRGIDADLYEFDFYSKTSNLPPVADFTFYPTNSNRNQNIYFTDESYDSDGIIVSWWWDFGDGSESTDRNPTYKYSNVGYYKVNLTVKDDEGTTDTISKHISIDNQKPNADFSYTPTKPTIENKIYFTDKSTDVDGYITSWFWDFGDGNSSSEKNPSHQYIKSGTYKVKLTVKDNDNSVSEINKELLISPAPKDWDLTLSGISNMIVNRKQFETWVTQYKTCWSDGNHTWCGLPLWKIIAMIDDSTPGDDIFNDSLAESGYTIRLTAGDSWITEIDSMDVAYNEGYLIVNTIDGDVLPDYTPKGHPSWPLHLRGSDIHPPDNVGNIISIEIILA